VLIAPREEGVTLDIGVAEMCRNNDREGLERLAEEFDLMAEWLLAQDWAHGDIKPDNIVITSQGLRLIDFDAAFVPEVLEPQPFSATLPLMKACTTLIVAALIPEAQPLKPVLDTLNPLQKGQVWGWWCGPEGDFTKEEMQTILDCGALPVTLGPLILRAETAAIYGLANLGCARNNTAFGEGECL
jgi:hypothetical protein